jgi:O-antigen/teichoic acid export membrane protein
MLLANILVVVFLIGIDQSGQYFISSGRMSANDAIGITLAIAAIGSALGVAVGWSAIMSGLPVFQKADRTLWFLSLALVPFEMLNLSFIMIFMGLRDFRSIAKNTLFQYLFQLAGIILLVAALDLGVGGCILAFIVSSAFVTFRSVLILRSRGLLKKFAFTMTKAREMLSFGGRYYVASLGTVMNAQIGSIVLAVLATEAEIGLFSLGVYLITSVIMIPDLVGLVLQPRISRDPNGLPHLTAQLMRSVTMVCLLLVLGLLLVSPWLVNILFSPKFSSILPLLWILAPGVVVRCAGKMLTPFVIGTNHPGFLSIVTLVSILVNAALLILFYPLLRLEGAALAMTGGFILGSFLLIIFFHRYSGLSAGAVWILRKSDIKFLYAMAEESVIHHVRSRTRRSASSEADR